MAFNWEEFHKTLLDTAFWGYVPQYESQLVHMCDIWRGVHTDREILCQFNSADNFFQHLISHQLDEFLTHIQGEVGWGSSAGVSIHSI